MSNQQLTKAENGNGKNIAHRLGTQWGVEPDKVLGLLANSVFTSDPPFKPAEITTAMILADQYKLNPFAKEIYLMRNRGKILTIVPIDGWTKICNQHPQFDGVEFQDHFDEETKKLAAITCRIHRKDRSHACEVTEYLDECAGTSEPWKRWPARMLRHKAYIQCARYAFGYSGIMDPDEADRVLDADADLTITEDVEREDASKQLEDALSFDDTPAAEEELLEREAVQNESSISSEG